jgi:hypothetical protein
MIRPAVALLLLAALPAPALAQPKPAAPHVQDSWVRLPAVAGRPAAGYFTLHGTRQPDALIGASSPRAERVEIHSMTMTDGVMRMRKESSIPVPAGSEVRFAPGGNHLMLFGLADGIRPGQAIPVTLSFQSGTTATVQAEARSPAAPTPKAAGHGH